METGTRRRRRRTRPAAPRRRPPRPAVTEREIAALFGELSGAPRVVAAIVHGTGLRLGECLRLRLGDVDLAASELAVRGPGGDRIRCVPFPGRLKPTLLDQMRTVRELHRRDVRRLRDRTGAPVSRGLGSMVLRRERAAHPLFPARSRSGGRGGRPVRPAISAASVRRALRAAARRAGLARPVDCRALRRACALRLRRAGYDPPAILAQMGRPPGTGAAPSSRRRRCVGTSRREG